MSPSARKYVVGLVGRKGAGKDTLFKIIKKHFPQAERLAFADPLKVEVYDALSAEAKPEDVAVLLRLANQFGVDLRPMWPSQDVAWDQKIAYIDRHKDVLRKILQHWGTEVRRSDDANYWVRKLDDRLRSLDTDLVVITDVRFANEGSYVSGCAGVLVGVDRPGEVEADAHVSEAYYAQAPVSCRVINPGTTVEEFEAGVGWFINYLRDWRKLRE